MLFTLNDIATYLPGDDLELGRQLFADAKVTDVNVQRGGELITGAIPQKNGRPFRVYVRAAKDRIGSNFHGECSCAKKQDCEHVAAVLLQALSDSQALPVDWRTVQGRRIDPPKKISTKSKIDSDTQQVLLYVLQLDEDRLFVEMYVARRIEPAGYSSVRPYDINRASGRTFRTTPPRFLEPIDVHILTELSRLPRALATTYPLLEGPSSSWLFESMLASGRLYFEDCEWGAPLSQAASRPLEMSWEADEYGYQLPILRTAPESHVILPLSNPWYLDSERQQCGPMATEIPVGLIAALLHLPPVPPNLCHLVYQTLVDAWPDAKLPSLENFSIEIAPSVKPVPCLRLTTLQEPLWDDLIDYRDFACLSFDYVDTRDDISRHIEVGRNGPTTRLKDGVVIQVQRDKKAEKAAVKLLHKLGMEEEQDWLEEEESDCFIPASGFGDPDVEDWLDFQFDAIPKLQALGWRIEYDEFRYRVAEPEHWFCDVDRLEQEDWFSIDLGVEVEGQRVDLLPILLSALGQYSRGLPDKQDLATRHFIMPYTDQHQAERLLRLPALRILPLLSLLLEIYSGEKPTTDQTLHFSRVQLARLTALDQAGDGPGLQWLADDEVQDLARRLRELKEIAEVAAPQGLRATLRPYQQQGLNWLQFLREYRLAGILADDMGLGKTVQALAHLLLEKESGRADLPSLVVAPTSLMFNWRQEAARFTPQLKVLVLHGPQRKGYFAELSKYDLVITTYPLLARDKDVLLQQPYHLVILDEAQVIKNAKAQASRVVRELDTRHRLCLTGTPLENHLGELWSLFDFLLPGLLGTSKQFQRFFRAPIEKRGDVESSEQLSRRIRPFLLRRTKQQVATELPEKTEIIQTVVLEDQQRELYETVRLSMHRRVREEIARQGLARSHIVVLDALLKLRQVCCDPRLLKLDEAKKHKQSAKLDTLMELLPEMIAEGRRILVFSQFTTMLGLIEDELKKLGIEYLKLTGQTGDRETPVRRFQKGEVPVFLISLKAGGVGLNLTAADTVIHYDPWWNPAVERQATDRAHRIGQQQAVFVYKLICAGTLEEKIHAMQLRKQALANGIYRSDGGSEPQWDIEDLEVLLGPLILDEKDAVTN